MTRKIHYLSGKRPYSNGDRLQERYDKIHGDHRPYLERNSGKMLVLCIVGLVTLGAAAWGMPKLFGAITAYIEMGVD